MRKVLFWLVILTLALASCGVLPPEADLPNMSLTVFEDTGATTYVASEFTWTENGIVRSYEGQPIGEEVLFENANVLCLAVLNSEVGIVTGGGDCRTATMKSSQVGTPIVETPQEIFDAIGDYRTASWNLTGNTDTRHYRFLAIYLDKDQNPLPGVSVRAAFIMLNRNNGMVLTDQGFLIDSPAYSEFVCVYVNDTENEFSQRECMRLPAAKG